MSILVLVHDCTFDYKPILILIPVDSKMLIKKGYITEFDLIQYSYLCLSFIFRTNYV